MSRIRGIFHNSLTLGSDKWDPYFDVYERYFGPFVGKHITFVEVGVQRGGSIQMWDQYFGSQAKIIGIDIDPNILNLTSHFNSNVTLLQGDQEDPVFWAEFLQNHSEIDLFLDDGGHEMQQQIVTFESVFPRLKHGGIYVCEDTHTSYFSEFKSSLYNFGSFVEYAKRLADVLNYPHLYENDRLKINNKILNICSELSSVHFYDSMIVFEKNGRKPFQRVYSLNA